MTKMELELIPDPGMYIFSEKDIRPTIFYISNRWSKVNNKHLKFNDTKLESKHNMYLDANHLSGYAMSKFLPTSLLIKWTDPKQYELNEYISNGLKGHVIKAHLEYWKVLCKLHNYYPFTLDIIEIERKMLSEYQLKMSDLYNVPIVNFKKLTPRTETKKIHRVLDFNQSQWLKPYIE